MTVTAWRFWWVPRLKRHRLVLRSPVMLPSTTWWHGGECAAACAPGALGRPDQMPHESPGVDCNCGVRGLLDLRELLAYGRGYGFHDRNYVVGLAELGGRLLGPARRDDDTASTVRASWGRVGERLFFPRPLWGHIAAFEQSHPWSSGVRVETLADVPAVVEATLPAVLARVPSADRERADLYRALFGAPHPA
jgi:hypothetical protein